MRTPRLVVDVQDERALRDLNQLATLEAHLPKWVHGRLIVTDRAPSSEDCVVFVPSLVPHACRSAIAWAELENVLAVVCSRQELVDAIPLLVPDLALLSHRVVRSANAHTITRRQSEILGLIAKGATNRVIAQQLFISPGTVKREIAALCRTYGVHSRLELALEAQAIGIVR